jgi:hypothetical protein
LRFEVSYFFLKITIEAMKSDIDEVALQGIEFWSNVCDEEMDLAIEASEVSLWEWFYKQGCSSVWAFETCVCGYYAHSGKVYSDLA